ncbi:MAG: hypothetical protein DHS20C16_34190 [Phycisphaerae bacterium]|nr:MAG: hypothetical protein DHS20C16_34190 [Phycisphaerae bacterium]
MAWMAVAEAAASLGVSERTIWRRIKSEAIESRGENGRTLVQLGTDDNGAQSNQPLSRMAFTQVSLRNMGSDPTQEFLAVLSDLRGSFDEQIAATRRSVRLLSGVVCVLIVALGAGVWFHFDQQAKANWKHGKAISDLGEQHQNEISELASLHQSELTVQAENIAHTEGKATAQLEELLALRDEKIKLSQQLSNIEASRTELASAVTEQAGAFEETTSKQVAGITDRDNEIRTLRDQISVLKEDLQEAVFLGDARMSQSDKVTEYIRRSAARSIGYADGVRQHLAYRAQKERELREELASIRKNHGSTIESPRDREDIWTSTIGEKDSTAPKQSESNNISMRTILMDCFNAWFFGRDHLDSLASASDAVENARPEIAAAQ